MTSKKYSIETSRFCPNVMLNLRDFSCNTFNLCLHTGEIYLCEFSGDKDNERASEETGNQFLLEYCSNIVELVFSVVGD